MRTRTRVSGACRSHLVSEHRNKYGYLYSSSTQDMAYLGVYRVIEDEPHPGFKELMKLGLPVLGALSVSETEVTVTDGFLAYPDGDSRFQHSGDLVTPFGRSPEDPLTSRNSTITACQAAGIISVLKKLNRAEVDTGEFLGTLGSTIGMLHRPFQSAFKVLTSMEKSRAKRLLKRGTAVREGSSDWLKATTDSWLEYSFGFRPIFGDVSKIIGAFEGRIDDFTKVLRVAKGGNKRSLTGASSSSYVHGGESSVTGLIAETSRQASITVLVGTRVYYKLPMNYPDAARALGLSTHNMAGSLWNLAPYSWIVDQFINVGDWIQACMPDPDLIYFGRCMTTRIESRNTDVVSLKIKRALGTEDPSWYLGDGGSIIYDDLTVNRVLDYDLPPPQWNPHIGFLAQALNDAAFGINTIRKVISRFSH